MSFFTYDEKQAAGGGTFEPLPKGEYEVVVTDVEVKTFNSGNKGLNVTLTIRDDVQQEGGKRKVFDTLVATEKAMFKFHQYAKAIGKESGWKADTLEEFAKEILFKGVRVALDVEHYTKNDGSEADRNVVKFVGKPNVPYGGSAPQARERDPFAMDGVVGISNDDHPF